MPGYSSLMMPTSGLPRVESKSQVLATSSGDTKYDLMYYLKSALAGGICCSITHGALCPVDVVKTRIQLDPVKFNRGLIGGFSQVIAEEGAGGLLTGLGPTVVGYFIQGFVL
jgi:solute carrier family 25 (mitochondrial phosphate transporter), member 3